MSTEHQLPSPHAALDLLFSRQSRVVLAVSGGLDSMCLLEAASARRPSGATVVVATFDHRTSPHSARAVRHVRARAGALGLPVVVGRATARARTEAAWRTARWAFLRDVARRHDAVVATAHTDDDHVETVAMRILRGAGARGLAGLLGPAPGIERPFVALSRASLEAHAAAHGISWHDDPTNQRLHYLRNRVRLDLLPALRAARPALPDELRAIARRSAMWRGQVAGIVGAWSDRLPDGSILVDVAPLGKLDERGRLVAWQAVLGAHGIAVDRRGLARLGAMDPGARTGYSVPLSGRLVAVRVREGIRVGASSAAPEGEHKLWPGCQMSFGAWVFRLSDGADTARCSATHAQEVLMVEGDAVVAVRAWVPGDRMRGGAGGTPRRVARFLADAGIAGPLRRGWPVVVVNGEITCIPGVRRAFAAPVRPGWPVRRLECERSSS